LKHHHWITIFVLRLAFVWCAYAKHE